MILYVVYIYFILIIIIFRWTYTGLKRCHLTFVKAQVNGLHECGYRVRGEYNCEPQMGIMADLVTKSSVCILALSVYIVTAQVEIKKK